MTWMHSLLLSQASSIIAVSELESLTIQKVNIEGPVDEPITIVILAELAPMLVIEASKLSTSLDWNPMIISAHFVRLLTWAVKGQVY